MLTTGPLIRENWKDQLINRCTNGIYLNNEKNIVGQENNKTSTNQLMLYYKFLSYRSFYKRVLGEKIIERKNKRKGKTVTVYRKTEDGDFERDISIDRIYNLDNSIIICDEAHNLTGNYYGEAY